MLQNNSVTVTRRRQKRESGKEIAGRLGVGGRRSPLEDGGLALKGNGK